MENLSLGRTGRTALAAAECCSSNTATGFADARQESTVCNTKDFIAACLNLSISKCNVCITEILDSQDHINQPSSFVCSCKHSEVNRIAWRRLADFV